MCELASFPVRVAPRLAPGRHLKIERASRLSSGARRAIGPTSGDAGRHERARAETVWCLTFVAIARRSTSSGKTLSSAAPRRIPPALSGLPEADQENLMRQPSIAVNVGRAVCGARSFLAAVAGVIALLVGALGYVTGAYAGP